MLTIQSKFLKTSVEETSKFTLYQVTLVPSYSCTKLLFHTEKTSHSVIYDFYSSIVFLPGYQRILQIECFFKTSENDTKIRNEVTGRFI